MSSDQRVVVLTSLRSASAWVVCFGSMAFLWLGLLLVERPPIGSTLGLIGLTLLSGGLAAYLALGHAVIATPHGVRRAGPLRRTVAWDSITGFTSSDVGAGRHVVARRTDRRTAVVAALVPIGWWGEHSDEALSACIRQLTELAERYEAPLDGR
ncbi:MAG: hypothetical protein AAFZ07_13530 [Actinomycetota bacterium]